MPVLRVVILGSEDKRCLRSVSQNLVIFLYSKNLNYIHADSYRNGIKWDFKLLRFLNRFLI